MNTVMNPQSNNYNNSLHNPNLFNNGNVNLNQRVVSGYESPIMSPTMNTTHYPTSGSYNNNNKNNYTANNTNHNNNTLLSGGKTPPNHITIPSVNLNNNSDRSYVQNMPTIPHYNTPLFNHNANAINENSNFAISPTTNDNVGNNNNGNNNNTANMKKRSFPFENNDFPQHSKNLNPSLPSNNFYASQSRQDHPTRSNFNMDNHSDKNSIEYKIECAKIAINNNHNNNHNRNTEIFSIFSDLQTISAHWGLKFKSPELVVVGMQSDGKSSFIEGLLGFQFNLVDTGIGTRRPLIIQMINDPIKKVPFCRFKKERTNNPNNNNIDNDNNDGFEEHETEVSQLSHEIQKRTNMIAGISKDNVSDEPIILRVSYQHCASLTIYDTPGFRLNGSESLKNNIMDMVLKIVEPPHRIIVCLDQSTVEWANSSSRPIIAQIDPNFSRTIIVNTKFDNRVKEFLNRESAGKYMMGENLPQGNKPFFISMPIKRDLSPEQFKEHIKICYIEDLKKLLEINFDEEQFGGQLGLFNLKTYLEKILYEQYLNSILPTLKKLDEKIETTIQDIKQLENDIASSNPLIHRQRVQIFIQKFFQSFEQLLHGSNFDEATKLFGQTLLQEYEQSGFDKWPIKEEKEEGENAINHHHHHHQNLDTMIVMEDTSNRNQNMDTINRENTIPSSQLNPFQHNVENLNLFGGAQFKRLLDEFRYAIKSIPMKYPNINEFISTIGINKRGGYMPMKDAAGEIARLRSKSALTPFIPSIIKRCRYIFSRIFNMSYYYSIKEAQQISNTTYSNNINSNYNNISYSNQVLYPTLNSDLKIDILDKYPLFKKEMNEVFNTIVDNKLLHCQNVMIDDIARLTSVVDWDMIKDVEINNGNNTNSDVTNNDFNYDYVKNLAQSLFNNTKNQFSTLSHSSLKVFLLKPLFEELLPVLIHHFSNMIAQKFENMFELGITDMENSLSSSRQMLISLKKSRDKFKSLLDQVKETTKKLP